MTRLLATLAAVSLGLTSTADAGHCHRSRSYHHTRVIRVVEPAPIYIAPAPIVAPPPAPLAIAAPAPLPLAPAAPLGPAANPNPTLGPAANPPLGPAGPSLNSPPLSGLPAQNANPANPAAAPRPGMQQAASLRTVSGPSAAGQNLDSLNAQLDALAQAGPAGLDPALLPLVGDWEAEIAGPNAAPQRILLSIRANGMASISIPTSGQGSTTLSRRMVFQDGMLSLEDGGQSMSLGRLMQADANQLILERSSGRLNFARISN